MEIIRCLNPECRSSDLRTEGIDRDGRGPVYVCRKCGACFDHAYYLEAVAEAVRDAPSPEELDGDYEVERYEEPVGPYPKFGCS